MAGTGGQAGGGPVDHWRPVLWAVPSRELEDITCGWAVDQILAAFAARLLDDLERTEAPIDHLCVRFLDRVPE